MGAIPQEISKIIREAAERARLRGPLPTTQPPIVDFEVERQQFIEAFRRLEPNFDIAKADGKILSSILAWVWRYDKWNALNLDYSKGMFFLGSLGRGKSLTLRALRVYMNGLNNRHHWKCEEDYRMGMRWKSASELANAYAADGQPALTIYYDCDVNLCIDELGREPNPANNYGTKLDVIQFLLQMRYDNRRTSVTHITTNFTLDQMYRTYGDYVADRCLEMFNFIRFEGKSFRG